MKKKLERQEVLQVAGLAKIKLQEEELETYSKQLGEIMHEIKKLDKVEITAYEPMIFPTTNVSEPSEDIPKNMLDVDEVLKNAPNTNGNYIEVPMVLNE